MCCLEKITLTTLLCSSAIGDWKGKKFRSEIDTIAKRATPLQWAKYCNASTAIKMFNSENTSMAMELRLRAYINERTQQRATFFDDAKRKAGRQCFWNRLDILKEIDFDWIDLKNDDLLRIQLKRLFFKF